MKMYLMDMGDYSSYIRDLINKDRLDRLDKSYINSKRAELKAELKKLEDLEKTKRINQDKINECLKYWNDVFKNKTFLDDKELERSIEKRVLPNLKKLGYTGSASDVSKLFLKSSSSRSMIVLKLLE